MIENNILKSIDRGAVILIAFLLGMITQMNAQETTLNLNHKVIESFDETLVESGVYDLDNGHIAVVRTSLNGFKGRKGLRKKALKDLKQYLEWNDIKVKQVNEKFRGPTGQFGVGPKLTMIFKIIEQ